MTAHPKILKEGYLQKVRSGGWGTNKRWFVLARELGTSTHTLYYFQNEAARKAHFSQPSGVYSVKQIKLVRPRDKEDPKNVGVSIYFKSNTPASPTPKDKEMKDEKSGDEAAATSPSAAAAADKSADHGKEHAGEKTFMILEAADKAEADAWIVALIKAHGDEGNIPQATLMNEETGRLREERAAKEKQEEERAKIEGELRKLKQSNKIGIGAWQARFFSLDAEFLSYYKSNKKGEPLGYFPVSQMVCVGTSPLQEETCFFFRLPATFATSDGKYLKSGAPTSPSASEGEGEEKKEVKPADAKAKDPIILLRCNTTAERDRWIQAFVDLGVKKAVGKDQKEHAKGEAKTKEPSKGEKPEKEEVTSSPASSSSSSSSGAAETPSLLPEEGD